MPASTAAERTLQARLAANTRWSKESPHGPDSTPAKARAGLEQKFLREADPDGTLPEPERRRRAESARKAYYQRMALASAKARRARKAARTAAATPDTAPAGGAA